MERFTPLELATLITRWTISEGATEAEVYIKRVTGYRVVVRAGQAESLVTMDEAGVGIRVTVGKRVGFTYASSLERAIVRELAREVVKLARSSPEDPYWESLPEPSTSYPEPQNIYNVELTRITSETLMENVKELLSLAKEKNLVVAMAEIGVARIERAIVNSRGIYRMDIGSFAYTFIDVLRKESGVTTPAIVVADSSRVSMPNVEALVERGAEITSLCLKRYKIDRPAPRTVVFAPEAIAELLNNTVFYSLRGDNVVRGRSYFAGKIGEQVLDPRITIVDDGVLKGGDNTWRFDGEGVATTTKTLVDRGVLKGFVFDTYWGRRAGQDTTGNAVRTGYTSTPRPGFTNIVMTPGDLSPEELLEGEVIVVYQVQGAHTTNSETGEYSVLANPAIAYRNGEPLGWVPGLMIAGNMYRELLEHVDGLSKQVVHVPVGVYLPWIRLSNIITTPKNMTTTF